MSDSRMGRNPTRVPLYLTVPRSKEQELIGHFLFCRKTAINVPFQHFLYGVLCLHDRSSLRLNIQTLSMFFLYTRNEKNSP